MTKFNIPVVLGSARKGRKSSRVSTWLGARLESTGRVDSEIIDLREADLPMMEERLRFMTEPPASVVEFGAKIDRADALVIVVPEYNGGYPGVLKNAIDYLRPEYARKPVGIVTVSSGVFGGLRVLEQMRDVMITAGAMPIPASLPVPKVEALFDENANLVDDSFDARAEKFVAELLWFTEAITDMKKKEQAATA